MTIKRARVRYLTVLVLAVACHGQPSPMPPDAPRALPISSIHALGRVNLTALIEWLGADGFRVQLQLENIEPDTARLEWGYCPVQLRAFAEPTLREPAIWDDHWRDSVVCYGEMIRKDVGPGDTATIERIVAPPTVESWPPPRDAYYGVVVIMNGQRRLLDAGRVRREDAT